MSGINGDKARFNRDRKKKIARRKRNHANLKFTKPSNPAVTAAGEKGRSA
jgi:hypothetical protein